MAIKGNLTNTVKFENVSTKFGPTCKIGFGVADREVEGKFYWATAYGTKALEAKAFLDDASNHGAYIELYGDVNEPTKETFVNRVSGEIMKSNTFVNNAVIRLISKTKANRQAVAEPAPQAVAEPAPATAAKRRAHK